MSEDNRTLMDAGDLETSTMHINLGPSHPAMHGVVRIGIDVDGEKVLNSDVEIGYLHRGFEKSAENKRYTQVFPYTDRLNYVSPFLNNFGFALAVEKLLGIEAPRRTQFIRVILGEISRITDHLTCNGAMMMELGGFTPYLFAIKARERLYKIIEKVAGARLTVNYSRVGGVRGDLPENFREELLSILKEIEEDLKDINALVIRNRIFMDRLKGLGILSKEDAIKWGITGPVGRASGFDYDVRRDHPYFVYDELDFDIPIGENGDNYDRFLVRAEEINQSIKIIKQALDLLPNGPIQVSDPRIIMPDKGKIYNTIESMTANFKLVIDGIKVPAGEVYSFTEAGNGELGFYIVSDGSGYPYRVRVRPPCFFNTQALPNMINGDSIGDIIPTFGSINMIAGELDR
ncbi:NADH-quinone oxidoreductase subunit D [bacterium]|nr:NADH-quinone oxidoreductase subunit D [bacterium]